MTDKTTGCDVQGCDAPVAVQVGEERRCYVHALERGNAIRAERGLPPLVIDEEGNAHVRQ